MLLKIKPNSEDVGNLKFMSMKTTKTEQHLKYKEKYSSKSGKTHTLLFSIPFSLPVDCVSSKVDKTKAELAVTISIPKDRANVAEEMVLTISACNKEEGNQEFVPVYYHLISLKRGASGGEVYT